MVNFIKPCEGVVTSPFGMRTLGGVRNLHQGVDFAKAGTVPIFASADGVVSRTYKDKQFGTYGNVVFIKHGNKAETVYAHLRSFNVKKDDVVKQGQQIGIMGNTDGGSGRSTGQHLHFEINIPVWNQKNNSVDPMPYLIKKEEKPKTEPTTEEVDEMAQLLPDTQKKDMKKLLQHAYDTKIFSVNHTSKVDKMTRGQATDFLISYVSRKG